MRVFTGNGGPFVRKFCLLGLAKRQMSHDGPYLGPSCCDLFDDAVLHFLHFLDRQNSSRSVISKLKHILVGAPWCLYLILLVLRGG